MEKQLTSFNTSHHVNLHNDVVLGRMDWSVVMHRIMMVFVSQIDSREDKEFEDQYVRVGDVRRASEREGNSAHRDIRRAAKRLVREVIEIEKEDGSYEGITVFQRIKYVPYLGLISAQFSEAARPYLLELEEKFTSWRLDQTLPLQSKHAIRHYMLGKMIERSNRVNQQRFPLEQYRYKMGLDDTYPRYTDLKRKVIKRALSEVNEKTDIELDFETVRYGQTPKAVEFVVEPPSVRRPQVRNTETTSPDVDPYEEWVLGLDDPTSDKVMERAREMAKSEGWDPDSKTFKAGMQVALRRLYQMKEEGRLSVGDGELLLDRGGPRARRSGR